MAIVEEIKAKLEEELKNLEGIYKDHIDMVEKYRSEIQRLETNILRIEGYMEGLKAALTKIVEATTSEDKPVKEDSK